MMEDVVSTKTLFDDSAPVGLDVALHRPYQSGIRDRTHPARDDGVVAYRTSPEGLRSAMCPKTPGQ